MPSCHERLYTSANWRVLYALLRLRAVWFTGGSASAYSHPRDCAVKYQTYLTKNTNYVPGGGAHGGVKQEVLVVGGEEMYE